MAPQVDDTFQKLLHGHTVNGLPFHEKQVPYQNFVHLWMEKVQQNTDADFLTFYTTEGERSHFSYADFFERSCQVANLLVHEFDINPGDKVASVAFNHPETVALMFACWMVGACYVPVNACESDERMVFILNDAKAKLVFVMPEFVQRVTNEKEHLENVCHFIQMMDGEDEAGFLNYQDMLSHQSTHFEETDLATLESEALIVYTSGTTGTPKGVVLDQYNCLVNAKEISAWYNFNNQSKAMLVLPIHHVNGIIVTLLTPLYAGGSLVLNQKFSASQYWQRLKAEKCSYGSVVPTILSFLCEAGKKHFAVPPVDYFLICGAGPLTVETGKKFVAEFGVRVNHGYGLSETTCYSCYLPFDLSDDDYDKWMQNYGYPSIGVALPCNEMDIHDEQGKPVKAGEKGEIVVKGHNVMQGYYNRVDANEEAFEHGWFKTGDEGFYQLDEMGRKFYFITGRLKELIIRGGVNYSPLELDELIGRIDGVKAGVAVGFENDMYGEEIGAYVVPKDGARLTELDVLNAFEGLPESKRPKVVVFGKDLPVTSTGKYQRNKLKALFNDWKGVQF